MNKYSFVIPTYQNRKLIKNTLQVLNYLELNSDTSFEVIVIDDGSTDDTRSYISGVNKNYVLEYIYLPRCEESSRARARNYGIRRATGNIIAFIDGDIIVKPNYLLQLNKYFEYSGDIAVVGTRQLLNVPIQSRMIEDKSFFNEDVLNSNKMGIDFRHKIFNDISYNAGSMDIPFMFALTCNLAVPKKWINMIGGFDEDLKKWGIEDIEFMYRVYSKGLKILINSRDEVIHQFHGIEEGDTVNEKQIHELDYNTSVFIKKHPYFMGLKDNKVYELFRSIATNYKQFEKDAEKSNVVINFNDIKQYNDVKEKITELMNCEKTKIIINDYVENTELDIWVQLLSEAKAKIRYYPNSKRIKR